MSEDQFADLTAYLDKRFDEQDKRLDKHDARFDALEQRLVKHDAQFEKLEKRLMEHDGRFERLEQHLADLADQMLRLYQHMEQRFDALEAKIDTKADAERVYSMLDGIVKRLDTDDAERAAMNCQLTRHERWHHEVADKLGMKLKYQEP